MSSHAIPAAAGAPRPLWGDERLAQRVADGDERAFAALYERYHQRLFRYCVSILRNEADAADALQSTFERALCALRAQQRNAPLRPWLYRIAHNEAITLIRRRPAEAPLDEGTPASVASAAHVAAERDRLATLVADLAALPERARSALVMRELEGLSHEEIAIALHTTVGAAKQSIFEARGALATAAEGREMSCGEIRRLVSDGDRRVLRGRRVRAHLNGCTGCAQFASAISERTTALRALAPPLAPVAAAAILARASGGAGAAGGAGVAGGAGGSGGGAGASGGGLSAAGAGKGALAAVAGSKAALGAAVLVTATAGVAAVAPLVGRHVSPAPAGAARPHSHHAGGVGAPSPGLAVLAAGGVRAAAIVRPAGRSAGVAGRGAHPALAGKARGALPALAGTARGAGPASAAHGRASAARASAARASAARADSATAPHGAALGHSGSGQGASPGAAAHAAVHARGAQSHGAPKAIRAHGPYGAAKRGAKKFSK